MCGRYTYKLSWKQIVELYRLTMPDQPPQDRNGKLLGPNYNTAPTHVMPIIRPAGNGRELVMAGWGLIPFWMKPENLARQAYATFNARADRIASAPTFREPFKKRRCLVPASGWYEWQKIDPKTKKPHHFQPKAEPFAFAGVYDVWTGDGKSSITSFSIVTTEAAPGTAKYHDRMPLILEDSQFDDWMRGPPELAAGMMKPYAGEIDIWEVAPEVGNVKNNKPELMEQISLT
ncbi:MAG TPA: SOS response-associated peptidase [Reyranella sp.]|jgi:putative SOS response-associated peptidase YedK|nr:SOS response-associated peptidase [Reyranella sp.]